MKVGIPGSMSPPLDRVTGSARHAESDGYDSIWWPDHLMGWHPASIWSADLTSFAHVQPNPDVFIDPVAALAVAAGATDRIQIGTAVTEPIRRHPAMLAQEFLTLDHFSQGRVVLGIGAGEGENVLPYGLALDRPVSRLEEALQIIRLLWETTDPVNHDGEFWTLRDAVLGLEPYQAPGAEGRRFPPIWSGAHGPRMLGLVGRYCDGWIPTHPGSPDHYARSLERIRDTAASCGRDPAAITAGMLCFAVFDETESQVERLLASPLVRTMMLLLPASAFHEIGREHPLGPDFYGLRDFIPSRFDRETVLEALEAVPVEMCRENLLCGTPDEIGDRLRAYEAVGCEHVVIWNVGVLADAGRFRTQSHLQREIARAVQGPRVPAEL